ncbi:Trm112p-like protein [Giardia muris]|uniref:Trm112p-like protein n=1 Tax=Giardia muris TaxID=5742 RepID=A0A4Z1SY86_GIAMU|nr:Trm112p-like protein [Giardia muris]|eukprot:TNJ30656.1 Trm112p-like protein [Giardia muris]
MRIFLLSTLACPLPECCTSGDGFDLQVEDYFEDHEPEFNLDIVRQLALRINYTTLYSMIGEQFSDLPPELPERAEDDMHFLAMFGQILYSYDIIQGSLVCRHCGCNFQIKDGIPHMRMPEEQDDE